MDLKTKVFLVFCAVLIIIIGFCYPNGKNNDYGWNYKNINELTVYFKKSIIKLNESIKLNPFDIDAYKERAFAKAFTGDKKGACLDWQKAVDLGDFESLENIKAYCHYINIKISGEYRINKLLR